MGPFPKWRNIMMNALMFEAQGDDSIGYIAINDRLQNTAIIFEGLEPIDSVIITLRTPPLELNLSEAIITASITIGVMRRIVAMIDALYAQEAEDGRNALD